MQFVLIFAIGGPLAQAGHPALRLLMGASFGIALTLVVFAGAELFTGNTLYMTLGWLRGGVRAKDLAVVWSVSWVGNLAGAMALCAAVVHVGSLGHARELIVTVSTAKMGAAPSVLVVSGVLCNLLVCLALWTAGRTRSDAAKIILICMCLMAFIASGYEHSIANMTLLGVGVLGQAADGIGWGGYFHNLLWVTLGNTLGGAVVLAGAFHLMAGSTKRTMNPEGNYASSGRRASGGFRGSDCRGSGCSASAVTRAFGAVRDRLLLWGETALERCGCRTKTD